MSWSKNQISTTLETLPISEVRFPKVTVCPPRNSFTNLNYDLLMAAGTKVNNSEVLLKSLEEKILDSEFRQAWKLLFEEKEKYRNWYQGYSSEDNPLDVISLYQNKQQTISSSASSGEISTPYFRQPFDISVFQNPSKSKDTKIEEYYNYSIVIDFSGVTIPSHNQHVKLKIRLESDLDIVHERVYMCGQRLWLHTTDQLLPVDISCPDGLCSEAKYKDKTCSSQVDITFSRTNLDPSEIEVKKLLNMTGVKVSWEYNKDVTAEKKYLSNSDKFINLANLVCKSGSTDEVWTVVKEVKLIWAFGSGGYTADNVLDKVEEGLQQLQALPSPSTPECANITDEELEAAAQMHVYMFSQTRGLWGQIINFFGKSKTLTNPRSALLLLGNMKPTNYFEESVKNIALESFSEHLQLKLKHLDNAAFMNSTDIDEDALKDIGNNIEETSVSQSMFISYVFQIWVSCTE